METVTLGRTVDGQPRWNPTLARFATELGFHPELYDPHAPAAEGERREPREIREDEFPPGAPLRRRRGPWPSRARRRADLRRTLALLGIRGAASTAMLRS